MNTRATVGVSSLLMALLLYLFSGQPGPPPDPGPTPPDGDLIDEVFDNYERLWRKLCLDAADKLKSGELETDAATRDFLAAAQQPLRDIVFDPIRKKDAEVLNGKWTPELHAQLLEEYAGGRPSE